MSYEKFFKAAQKARSGNPGKPIKGTAPKFALKKDTDTAKSKKRLARAGDDTPERRLRAELAQRLQAKKTQRRTRRAKFPVFASAFAVVTFVGCSLAYVYSDETLAFADRMSSKFDISFLGQANAAAAEDGAPAAKTNKKKAKGEKTSTPDSETAAKGAEAKGAAAANETPNIKQWTPEELSFFGKLNDRKKELDQREADLNKLDEELHKRESELENKLKNLESMRGEISKTLKGRVAADQEKVDKLVQFYSTMKPQTAAKVIESLNEDLAVEVLDKMKKKSAAEIMDMMDAKKARRLSELLTGYIRSAASVSDDEASAETGPAKKGTAN